MALVLDASITLAWAFQEVDPTASEARERLRHEDAVVPSFWWFEVRNGLVMGERRRVLTEQRTGRFLRDLARVAIIIDGIPDEPAVLTLARRRRLTVYDAAYLECGPASGLNRTNTPHRLPVSAGREQRGKSRPDTLPRRPCTHWRAGLPPLRKRERCMLFWWALSSLDPERTLRSILARAGRDCQASGRSYPGWLDL